MSGNHRISTSLTLIVNLFLILSTVVGFAVLTFLSYENLVNTSISDVIELSEIYANNISTDMDFLVRASGIDEDNQEEYLNTLITIMDSKNRASGCNLFLFDNQGNVLHRSVYSPNVIDIDYNFLINNLKYEGQMIKYGKVEGGKVIAFTAKPITDTTYHIAAVKSESTEAMMDEFKNIVLFPWIIAIMLSLVLCLTFIHLSLKPVREMSDVIGKVARGDYSVRVNKKYMSDNEFNNDSLSSDLSEMAKTVNYMIDVLENQEHDRNIFISSVAHDIRTPLTSINGFITAMIDGVIPEDMYVKYFDMIKNEVVRIRTLVNSMTEASSLSHVDPASMEVFSFRDMVNDIVSGLEPQLNQKYIVLIKDFIDTDSFDCFGDPQLLSRVVYNIINNAIKFTPSGGKIKVTAFRDIKAGKLRISIDDSGPGVPPDKRSRVFESFYKLDSSRKQEGFGLGLYICKQIIVGHGQSIYLDESSSYGGASFRFTFALPRNEIENNSK